jgi:hypothetical protein
LAFSRKSQQAAISLIALCYLSTKSIQNNLAVGHFLPIYSHKMKTTEGRRLYLEVKILAELEKNNR